MIGIQSQVPWDSMPRVNVTTQVRFTLFRWVPRKRRQQVSEKVYGSTMDKGKIGTDDAKYQWVGQRRLQKHMNECLRLPIKRIPPSDDESIWETVRLTKSGHLKMMLVPQSLAELEKPKELKPIKCKWVATKPVEKLAAFFPLECFLMEGVSISIFLASKRNQGRTLDAEVRWLSEWTPGQLSPPPWVFR